MPLETSLPRELTSHKVNALNDALKVSLHNETNQIYSVSYYRDDPGESPKLCQTLLAFQVGPVEGGVNGISNEALLAVIEDRLMRFQEGPTASRENALALTKIQEAMHWLNHRTRERQARGVEGTLEK